MVKTEGELRYDINNISETWDALKINDARDDDDITDWLNCIVTGFR